jgi:hypothetical protein
MDLLGHCKNIRHGHQIYAFTKFAKIAAIPNKHTITLVDVVFAKWICKYGCPSTILTDMGKEIIKKLSV